MNLIRSGKKKKTVSGFKEKQNITITNEGGKVIATQKEKKVEEVGVTRQKRNFIEFESKLGTERNTDVRKIKGPTLRAVEPRVEEKIVMKKKKKEYLDNYEYRETKNFKKNPSKPSIVIHRRLGNIYGATVEEVQYIKTTTDIRPSSNSVEKNRSGDMKSILKQNRSVSNLRGKPNQPRAVATKTTTTTTKVTKRTTGTAGTVPLGCDLLADQRRQRGDYCGAHRRADRQQDQRGGSGEGEGERRPACLPNEDPDR